MEYKWIQEIDMTHAVKSGPEEAPQKRRKSKFQADLAPSEDSMVRALKAELQLTSNSDLLADAVALFRWAVTERKHGRRILSEGANGERRILIFPRLERVAPELDLPRVEMDWSDREIESLMQLSQGPPAEPTEALIRAMRG
jgi:hypothetical protein